MTLSKRIRHQIPAVVRRVALEDIALNEEGHACPPGALTIDAIHPETYQDSEGEVLLFSYAARCSCGQVSTGLVTQARLLAEVRR